MIHLSYLQLKDLAKNLFVFIPLFFAGYLFDLHKILQSTLGFFAFSLVAASTNMLNDLNEKKNISLQPEQANRPLSNSTASRSKTIILLTICALAGFVLAYLLNTMFFLIVFIFFAMQLLYLLGLKYISILNMMIISIGFVLRVLAGGALNSIHSTPWLIILVFLITLFMTIAQWKDNIMLVAYKHQGSKAPALNYHPDFISTCLAIVSAVIIVTYTIYTIMPATIDKFHAPRLYYTSLFVMVGIFRFLQLTFAQNGAATSHEIMYKDKFIQVTILLWIASFYFIIYFPDIQIFTE